MLKDADEGLVRSGWYNVDRLSGSGRYMVDQRQTDWNQLNILEHNVALSDIPIATFTLP